MEQTAAPARRLAAVLFTDVVGYSSRMQRDEIGTMALVRADFARIRELCGQHGGEVLNTMGDGMLLCFPSAVQAVVCALKIQSEFAHRHLVQPPEQALDHRIGIHVGDVFPQGGQVVGDGVNIAARLQTKAPAGGICVSQTVHDMIKGKVNVQAVALGPQDLKNIAEKMPAYQLVLPGGAPSIASPPSAARPGRSFVPVLALAAVLVVTALAGAWWWKSRLPAPKIEATAPPAAGATDKSIAVLPFTNLSEDKANGYFADGIHEDILTDLANVGDLKVIARTSVMQYRDSQKRVRQIGEELGVSYVLEGSVQRAGNKVRVTGQLIDARTEGHVWAQRYDREVELGEIFTIQSALATEIASSLHAVLSPDDKARLNRPPTESVEAYDLYLRSRAFYYTTFGPKDMIEKQLPLLQRAVEIDPRFALAWRQLATVHGRAYATIDPSPARLAQAKACIDTALRLAPNDPAVIMGLGNYYENAKDLARAAETYQQVVRAFPNEAEAFFFLSYVRQKEDRWTDALASMEKARELDPRSPLILEKLSSLLFGLRRYDESARRQDELKALTAGTIAPLLERYYDAMQSFSVRGATGQMEALVAGLSPEVRRTDPNAIYVCAHWAAYHGDAGALVRLWQETSANTRPPLGPDLWLAASHLKLAQPDQARPILDQERSSIRDRLGSQPADTALQLDLALVQAMLGEKAAAQEILTKLRPVAGHQPGDGPRGRLALKFAQAYAWTGQKDEATAELALALRQPGLMEAANVHVLRGMILWWPLQGDPAFEALLNDPKNNAPLL
ncbi:MAG TPA: adenylate/guanylate cyclase domain-containing protein [Opitutaceae bacterium]|nr:adenylate/guanylate cyclase domain-containing protein [Opitutaceae bacterium]